jgi:hypothetical protein
VWNILFASWKSRFSFCPSYSWLFSSLPGVLHGNKTTMAHYGWDGVLITKLSTSAVSGGMFLILGTISGPFAFTIS